MLCNIGLICLRVDWGLFGKPLWSFKEVTTQRDSDGKKSFSTAELQLQLQLQ